MKSEQAISVVMCTYNGERYLREQLDSIFSQTLPPAEVVVQDDGSTDSTPAILEEYARRYPNLRVFHNEGPHGINPNFFSAMRRARCELIALSDQDDIWEPDKLRLQAQAMGRNLLCSGYSIPFSTTGYPVSYDRREPNRDMLRLCYIGALAGHTFLLRRELLDYLPEGADCPYLYDWQLQMAAAAAERLVFVPRPLVRFRRHADAATAIRPVDSHWASRSSLDYVVTTLFHHATLQRHVRQRFRYIGRMTASWPFTTQALADCRQMTQLQTRTGWLNFIRKTCFFVKHRTRLFYSYEPDGWRCLLRALYFSYSCGYYYRAILKQKK